MFGSYPVWVNNYYKVRLTVEAASLEILSQVDKVTVSSHLLMPKDGSIVFISLQMADIKL